MKLIMYLIDFKYQKFVLPLKYFLIEMHLKIIMTLNNVEI